MKKGFSHYILEAEKRLSNANYKESRFELSGVLEDCFELLEESQNLPKTNPIRSRTILRAKYT